MVWGNYKTNSPLFSLFGSSPYQIIVLQSSLGFYNVIVSLTTDAEPDILGIMPFLAEPINQVTINRLIRENHIDPKYNSVLLHFYYSLPVVDIDEDVYKRQVDTFNEEYRLKEEGEVLNWFDIDMPEGYFNINDKIGDIMKANEGKMFIDELMLKIMKGADGRCV